MANKQFKCPCCGAPKDYLYDNNGKQTQFLCKVCSHTFSTNPNKDKNVINIHKITNTFYDEYYSDVYESDKQNLLYFSKFVGNSIIFAHNAPFDMTVLNSELKHWGLNEIPIKRYRCSMRIFMDIIGKIDIRYSNSFTSLTNCCEYFKLKSGENNFHNALFDSFMTSKMICKIYETLDKNEALRKKYDK